jgi:hypothetical protein
MVNKDTHLVARIPNKPPYPGFPIDLPRRTEEENRIADAIMRVPQPHIMLCGKPGPEVGAGCPAAVGNGCPILLQYGRVGPRNMILEKYGKIDSFPCYQTYCGITPMGRPTSQGTRLLKDWTVLTNRTTIVQNIHNPVTLMEEEVETEVPNLAPFYDAVKKKRAEAAESVAPKRKRGRPRKNGNREGVGTGVQANGL